MYRIKCWLAQGDGNDDRKQSRTMFMLYKTTRVICGHSSAHKAPSFKGNLVPLEILQCNSVNACTYRTIDATLWQFMPKGLHKIDTERQLFRDQIFVDRPD